MTGFSDSAIIWVTIAVCTIFTIIDIAIEVCVKTTFGWNHVGKAQSYLWFGAQNNQLTEMKWLTYSCFVTIPAYCLSLIIYRLVKMRARKSILTGTHSTRVESSANGMTNIASVVIMILFICYVIQVVIARQAYSSGPILEMPMSGLIVHSFWNATSASWVFFNREALRFVARRLRPQRLVGARASVAPAIEMNQLRW